VGWTRWFTSHGFAGVNAALNQAFQGAVGTAVKAPLSSNALFSPFTRKWEELYPGNFPWYGKNEVALPQFTAQVYDAIAMFAQAATNDITDKAAKGNVLPTGISRAEVLAQLNKKQSNNLPFCITPGLGNTNANGQVTFDTEYGAMDGIQEYEIVNRVGDAWKDVGDWVKGAGYTAHHDITWPGSLSKPPQVRGSGAQKGKDGKTVNADISTPLPPWVVPMIVILSIVAICSCLAIYYVYQLARKGKFVMNVDEENNSGL